MSPPGPRFRQVRRSERGRRTQVALSVRSHCLEAESCEAQRRRPVLPLAVPRFGLWQPCNGGLCVVF